MNQIIWTWYDGVVECTVVEGEIERFASLAAGEDAGDAAPSAAVDRLYRVADFAQRFTAELRQTQLIRRPFPTPKHKFISY